MLNKHFSKREEFIILLMRIGRRARARATILKLGDMVRVIWTYCELAHNWDYIKMRGGGVEENLL